MAGLQILGMHSGISVAWLAALGHTFQPLENEL